jgi:hypothetical protein
MCPICRQYLGEEVEMHETLITRGDVQGLPFETQIQIYCPQNISLLHSECHRIAQWTTRGKRIVARDIIRWNGEDSVRSFLVFMENNGSSASSEAIRRLTTWNFFS